MGVKVRERPKDSGEWWIVIDHKGRRLSKKVGKDKKAAMKLAGEVELELARNGLNIAKKPTPRFKDYATCWLEMCIKGIRRESTFQRYQGVLKKHVFPVLGNKPLDQITRSDIRKLLSDISKKGYSRATVCLVRDVISGPAGLALDEELIASNPVSGITKRMKLGGGKHQAVETFTPGEVVLFLDTCKEHFSEYYPFFLCAFRTGMRLGEVLALCWDDIDWSCRCISIDKSYRYGTVSKTKTGKSRRVDMSDQLTNVLRQLHTQRMKESVAQGMGRLGGIVFHRNGTYMEQNFIRRIYKKVLKKAGIHYFRFHNIRHTFASFLLTNGESPVYVKEQLGHSSIAMTVDTYGHLIPSVNRDAVNRLDKQSATFRNPSATYQEKRL